MRKQSFVQIRADDWEDAVALGKGFAGHAFRGQSNAQWLLSTTVERAARRYGFPDGGLRNREVVLLNNFQRRAHHYINDLPSIDDRLEWLALMQLHGAPTRLLDCTHSFYVAAFFAMESAEQGAAIWALSSDFTMGHTSNHLNETQTILDLENESREVVQVYLSGCRTRPCVMLVEPYRMNARLAVQQGCFVMPGDLGKSFMDNLAFSLGEDVTVFTAQSARPIRRGDAARFFDTPVVKIVLGVPVVLEQKTTILPFIAHDTLLRHKSA